MRATYEATAVVSDYTVVLREDRLLQQWSKAVSKDASVHEHNRLPQALDFELQVYSLDTRVFHETIHCPARIVNQ